MHSILRPFRVLLLSAGTLLVAHAAAAQPAESPAAPPATPVQPDAGAVVEPPPAAANPAPAAEAPPPTVAPPAPATAPVRPAAADLLSQKSRHGLGFAGGFTSGSGFSYRRYFEDTAAQLNGIAIVSDYGNDALVFGGLSVIQYLMRWHQGSPRSIMPSVTALRFVAGATYFFSRRTEMIEEPDPSCSGEFGCNWIMRETKSSDTLYGLGAGIGFEFGAVQRTGFSVSLDLLLTAGFDEQGLSFILPLPSAGLMYNW